MASDDQTTGANAGREPVGQPVSSADIQSLRDKLRKMANDLQDIYTKVLSLEETLASVDGGGVSVEEVEPRLPRRLRGSDEKTLPPGDSDTSDPWQVPDGTADWDVNDAVHAV